MKHSLSSLAPLLLRLPGPRICTALRGSFRMLHSGVDFNTIPGYVLRWCAHLDSLLSQQQPSEHPSHKTSSCLLTNDACLAECVPFLCCLCPRVARPCCCTTTRQSCSCAAGTFSGGGGTTPAVTGRRTFAVERQDGWLRVVIKRCRCVCCCCTRAYSMAACFDLSKETLQLLCFPVASGIVTYNSVFQVSRRPACR